MAKAYNLTPHLTSPTRPSETHSPYENTIMKAFQYMIKHMTDFFAIVILCALWSVALLRAAWHIGMTSETMRHDVATLAYHDNNDFIMNPIQMNAASTMIDLIQKRQSCMHNAVYCICRQCASWVCIACGMVTMCTYPCVHDWDSYINALTSDLIQRANELNIPMQINDLELTVQTVSLNLVELGSAGYGAINCDSSPFVGVHSATGEMLQNLQCYTGERIYLAPYSFAPQFSIKAFEMIRDIMRSKYMVDIDAWMPRSVRAPQYLTLMTCGMCKVKACIDYCLVCCASVCLTCGMISACACNYGTKPIIGAHAWRYQWQYLKIPARANGRNGLVSHDALDNWEWSKAQTNQSLTTRVSMIISYRMQGTDWS